MEAAQQWLERYGEQVARAAEGAKVASEQLQHLNGQASSPRGEVSVLVGPSGALEDIRLTVAARALEVDQLARLILETTQQARRAVGAQVVDVMTEYVGDGPALDMVKQNLPVEPGATAEPVDDDSYFSAPPVIVR